MKTRSIPRIIFISLSILLPQRISIAFADTPEQSHQITDSNMKIQFEVHSPWNILDGIAKELHGNVSLTSDGKPDSIRADISAQEIDYKAGLRPAGQVVAAWLRANPPTPAKFVIGKASFVCAAETLASQNSCKGVVDGTLTIWSKDYTIDIPIEMKATEKGQLLTGAKEIKWGEYGFGDPNSTISNLKPIIDLNFSIELPKVK